MFVVKKQFFLASSLLLTSLVVAPLTVASPKAKQHFDVARISGDITIDATLNEPQWKNATEVELDIVTRPYDNTPSPIKTKALLMEDGEVFYLAFKAYDPNPEKIRAFLRDRDKSWGDDTVGIKIDTYNDQRSAYRFLVNPMGSQIDGIENEVTQQESDSWDGIWDSAGQITDEGYIVEMALPLRMLNFNESKNIQDWGIELMRFYPREENLRISNIYMDRNNSCELCQLHTASGFEGAKQGDNLIIAPSLVTGKHQQRNENDEWDSSSNTDASLDLRWGITPDILLNATINPDFSTVETDNAQLNINNNFALFFPEKRPFFLDNADYFNSNYNLVYTRNINAPNYGAKITGRKDNHALGVFVTDDDTTNILIPGNRSSSVASIDDKSQAAVLRYRYNYGSDTTLGYISTMRASEDYSNAVHGVDGRFRLSTYDTFKFQYLYSDTEYPEDMFKQFCGDSSDTGCTSPEQAECEFANCDYNEKVLRTLKDDAFSGNAFKASYVHNDEHWHYKVTYDKQNKGFRGDLGFISLIDHNKLVIGGHRKWYAEPGQWWTSARLYSDWDITHNDKGELIEKELDVNASINGIYSSYLSFSYSNRDLVGSRIDKSSLAIDGNTTLFNEEQYTLSGEIKPILGLKLYANLHYGDAIDYTNNRLGLKKQFNTTVNWNVNKHFEMRVKQVFQQLNADQANVFTARLTDMRATYQFDVRSFVRLTLVYNNTNRNPNNYLYINPEDIKSHSKNLSTELLYAYKINPQTVFYLGYSDYHNAEQNFSDLKQNERSMFMKFSYAWIK